MSFLSKLKLSNYFMSNEKKEKLIANAVDEALTQFRNTHDLRGNKLSEEEVENLRVSFDSFFSLYEPKGKELKVRKEVKEIILSLFNNPPEVDLHASELNLVQDACWVKYVKDPIIRGMVDNFQDYVLGAGVAVSTPIEEINIEIDKFRKMNKLVHRERQLIKSTFIDGEYFNLIFSNPKTGDCYLRKGHPKTIKDIERANEDIETVFSFYQEFQLANGQIKGRWIKDIDYDARISEGIISSRSKNVKKKRKFDKIVLQHIKLNDTDKERGLPPLFTVLKWAKLFENFTLDRITLNHERAKVVWIKKIIGRTKDALKSFYRAPSGGTMLVEREGVEFRTEKPNLDSSEAKEDALNLLYYIGSALRYPLHILNQRTSEQVYASIRKADTPFVKMIESWQLLFAYYFEEYYRYLIQQKVAAGQLKPKYKFPIYSEDSVLLATQYVNRETQVDKKDRKPIQEIMNAASKIMESGVEEVEVDTVDIPISLDFPQMVLDDPKEMAEVLRIHKEIGLASIATLSTKAGYVWKREKVRLDLEYQDSLEKREKDMELTDKYAKKEVDKKETGDKKSNKKEK